MRGHAMHIWICVAIITGAAVAVIVTGSPLALIPIVGCVVMLVVMVQIMGGTGGDRGQRRDPG